MSKTVHLFENEIAIWNDTPSLCGTLYKEIVDQLAGMATWDRVRVAFDRQVWYKEKFCKKCLVQLYNVVLIKDEDAELAKIQKRYQENRACLKELIGTKTPLYTGRKKDYK